MRLLCSKGRLICSQTTRRFDLDRRQLDLPPDPRAMRYYYKKREEDSELIIVRKQLIYKFGPKAKIDE